MITMGDLTHFENSRRRLSPRWNSYFRSLIYGRVRDSVLFFRGAAPRASFFRLASHKEASYNNLIAMCRTPDHGTSIFDLN